MATPAGGTPIAQGIVDRVAGVMVGAIRGASEAWFGPQQPLNPVAPESTRGRAFDYTAGMNLGSRPRSEQGQGGVDFATLRALADPALGGFDLLRGAIETVKDSMAAQRVVIRPRSDKRAKRGTKPEQRKVDRALEISDIITGEPDGVHTYRQWQRMLLEDLLVIDAPAVYLAPSSKGYRVPQVMDGALLKRLVDGSGRTPMPPEPAYAQVLKGVPAVHYSLDEIAYGAQNLRSNRLYGMGRIEQVITTVNIALRRQVSQLEYYTAGSVPDMLLGVPDSWSASQIREWQAYFDSMLSGNTEERRRARFIPGAVKPFPVKEGQLKDSWDEWLARIICWVFSISPQALLPNMNRATAETAREQAQLEGLEPLKLWWADYLNQILRRAFDDGAEYEAAYEDEEIADAATKASVITSLKTADIISRDEAREVYGYAPESEGGEAEADGLPVDPALDGAAAVQDTALNGAQVTSLREIVTAAVGKELPLETARAMVAAAFPSLSAAQLDAIIGPLATFEAEKPEPPPSPFGPGVPPPPPPKGGKQLALPLEGVEGDGELEADGDDTKPGGDKGNEPEVDEAKAMKAARAELIRKARRSLRQGKAAQARPAVDPQGHQTDRPCNCGVAHKPA